MAKQTEQERVDAWNAAHQINTPVFLRSSLPKGGGGPVRSSTTGQAFIWRGNASIYLKCQLGAVPLSRVFPIDEDGIDQG